MAKILIAYSTTDGHTHEICLRLCQILQRYKNQVTLISLHEEADIDLNPFDKIVVGASVRYGKHRPELYRFVKKHCQLLDSKRNAFFSVNAVARKPEKSQPATNPYLVKFLKQISWYPKKLAVFAGKISYPKYTFWDRLMIRFIMWMTKGPTNPQGVFEFTDWQEVETFADYINTM